MEDADERLKAGESVPTRSGTKALEAVVGEEKSAEGRDMSLLQGNVLGRFEAKLGDKKGRLVKQARKESYSSAEQLISLVPTQTNGNWILGQYADQRLCVVSVLVFSSR